MALALALSSTAAQADFLPENNLGAEDRILRSGPVTEAVFNEVIDQAESTFGKIIRDNYNVEFKINRLWSNSQVNASARQENNVWLVDMYGGMARRPEITRDGFTLVLCHEIGHHLGGYPYQKNFFLFGSSRDWAAAEGEADYFAAQACSRLLWKNDYADNATFRSIVPAYPKSLCDASWSEESDQDLCYREMMANKSVADVNAIAEFFKKPDWSKPSKEVVRATDTDHPSTQCRLDTYMAGALCVKSFDENIIPAKYLDSKKRNSVEGELDAAKYSCMENENFSVGFRPRCWFKPLVDNS